MAWRIHRWSAEDGIGEVVSPHFGPWRFGPDQNPKGTDFVVGEEVRVQLSGGKDNYEVSSVVRVVHRAVEMPEGAECAELVPVNAARHEDMHIEDRSSTKLCLWVGDCCSWCGDSWVVSFDGVSNVVGLDDDSDLDRPVFRLATDAEVRERGLVVPSGSQAYRIVTTQYSEEPPPPGIFVVAESVEASARPAVRD